MNIIILYHANCLDGFTAAFYAAKFFGVDEDKLIPVEYGKPAPKLNGEHVLIVDFSYPVAQLKKIKAKSILILDHHISAEKDLAELPRPLHGEMPNDGIWAVFNQKKSGASLVWWWFHKPYAPPEEMPLLIQHVEDRDLWKFKLNGTKDFNAHLAIKDKTFDQWQKVHDMSVSQRHQFYKTGAALRKQHEMQCRQYLKSCYAGSIVVKSQEQDKKKLLTVPVYNVPFTHTSDLCDLFLTENNRPIVATFYHDSEGMKKWSLRSAKDGGPDVSIIAKQYGGGGHKNAAGFTTSAEDSVLKIVNTY